MQEVLRSLTLLTRYYSIEPTCAEPLSPAGDNSSISSRLHTSTDAQGQTESGVLNQVFPGGTPTAGNIHRRTYISYVPPCIEVHLWNATAGAAYDILCRGEKLTGTPKTGNYGS